MDEIRGSIYNLVSRLEFSTTGVPFFGPGTHGEPALVRELHLNFLIEVALMRHMKAFAYLLYLVDSILLTFLVRDYVAGWCTFEFSLLIAPLKLRR